MKFLADMGISPQSVLFLRNLGHDATHLSEQGLFRLADAEIIRKARAEERIILTHDLDFGHLMAASGASLPTVIIFRLSNMQPANVNAHLRLILAQYQDVLTTGAILSVAQGQVRVRQLPIA